MDEKYLLEVKNLNIGFDNNYVVDNISFTMEQGEILGIVGESGSGKTMTALAIMGLLPKNAKIAGDEIMFCGRNLLTLADREFRNLKGKELSMIFQEPMTSLNPVRKVGVQVEEMLIKYETMEKQQRRQRVIQIFEEVGLMNASPIYHQYPHQLSGGMRQRVMIAMAMICRPKLMIADEPTTALDVTIQAQILELIQKLNREYNTSILFISHDLGVVKSICSRALVMCQGKIVEEGSVEELFYRPKEKYTRKLIEAVPGKNKRILHTMVLEEESAVLEIHQLNTFYEEKQKKLFSGKKKKQILKNVELTLKKGEILGIVGESGSGKSTLAKAVTGLLKDMQGSIELNGIKPRMVFQDPYSSLNPVKKIGWILEEPLKIKGGFTKKQREEKVFRILEQVGLEKEHAGRYIYELSGGQRQRVSIANAIILNAGIIVLDEPVSALDVTVQAQILKLLLNLREEYQLSYLFISHDLNVIRQVCDRVCVMYQGEIVETADVEELYHNPSHDYSRKLLQSIVGMHS